MQMGKYGNLILACDYPLIRFPGLFLLVWRAPIARYFSHFLCLLGSDKRSGYMDDFLYCYSGSLWYIAHSKNILLRKIKACFYCGQIPSTRVASAKKVRCFSVHGSESNHCINDSANDATSILNLFRYHIVSVTLSCCLFPGFLCPFRVSACRCRMLIRRATMKHGHIDIAVWRGHPTRRWWRMYSDECITIVPLTSVTYGTIPIRWRWRVTCDGHIVCVTRHSMIMRPPGNKERLTLRKIETFPEGSNASAEGTKSHKRVETVSVDSFNCGVARMDILLTKNKQPSTRYHTTTGNPVSPFEDVVWNNHFMNCSSRFSRR